MNKYARYYRDCVRAALNAGMMEPLGSKYGLHRDEAIEIAGSAWATLVKAGLKTQPRYKPHSPGMEDRINRSYASKGLRAVP